MRFLVAIIVVLFAAPASAQTDGGIYTLYRNSVLDASMRIHIATFDAEEGEDYNAENCNIAADLFQRQPDVETRFWCEPGRYHD
jgi:hypothetical protein